jgi:hypothetical protein
MVRSFRGVELSILLAVFDALVFGETDAGFLAIV